MTWKGLGFMRVICPSALQRGWGFESQMPVFGWGWEELLGKISWFWSCLRPSFGICKVFLMFFVAVFMGFF